MNSIFRKSAIATAIATCFGVVAAQAAEVDTKGGLKVKSDDGLYSFEFGGRLQVDGAAFDNDGDVFNSGGTELRRFRFHTVGTYNTNWLGKLEFNFAPTTRGTNNDASVTTRDAYIQYKGFEVGSITVGQFKTPISLETLTSDLHTTFAERSLAFVLTPEYRRGVGFGGARGNFSYSAMGYTQGNRSEGSNTDPRGDTSEHPAIGGRLTWTPLKDKTQILHLGIAAADEFGAQSLGAISSRPENNMADAIAMSNAISFNSTPAATPPALNGNRVEKVEDVTRLGGEIAYVRGPFSAQGEYLKYKASHDPTAGGCVLTGTGIGNCFNGGGLIGDVELDGYYGYVSYFLTGESRTYKASNGTFDRIIPMNKDRGAWEIAARYSNLKNDDFVTTLVTGTGAAAVGTAATVKHEISDITLGVNWYVNPQVKLQANLIQSDIDAPVLQPAAPARPTFNTNGKPKSILLRAQWDF